MGLSQAAIVAAVTCIAAGCCPRSAAPPFPVPPPPPAAARSSAQAPPRSIPAPVVGRFHGQPSPADVPTPESPLNRETITEPPRALPGPKLEEVPIVREPLPAPRPQLPLATLPDEVVMRILETGRVVFVRCFKKAIAADPTELSFKVRLRVELDDSGAITAATTDAANAALDACLTRAARWLRFPESANRVAVELPLFYRAE